jgi:hypothetical protein
MDALKKHQQLRLRHKRSVKDCLLSDTQEKRGVAVAARILSAEACTMHRDWNQASI